MPLAVSPDGSAMLVARDYGSRRDVALVRGDAPARSIYSVPQPDQNQVVDASMDGGHAALDLDRLPRNANGVIPTARKVLLIDLSNGAIKQLDGVSDAEIAGAVEHKTINGSLLWNGHVYWNVKKTFASATSTIKDYDLATGETSVAGQGVGQAGSGAPTLLPTGVAFNYPQSQSVAVPRTVPADLPAAATADVNRLVTDGTAYAWVTKDHKVMSWGPERNAITTVRLPRGVLPSLQAVGGGFVFFADEADVRQRNFVLDVRTGAVAALAEMQPFGYSATGVVVGYRFVGAVKESATAAARLDTRKLPELTC
jgi:hypothetical protein